MAEKKHHIDFPISGITAGKEENIPIPGLSIAVPHLGNLGVDAAVLIDGNPDKLTLKVGLNACVAAGKKDICASDIPFLNRILPVYILHGTYSFGHVCNKSAAPLVAPFATTTLYQIKDGECGQFALDSKYAGPAKAFDHDLKEGTCASVGYTQADGTKSMKVPVLGEITVDLFKKPAFLFDTDCNQYNTVKSCDAIKGCAWSHFGCVRTSPRL